MAEYKVKITIEYPYGGDNDDIEAIREEEHNAITGGEVSLEDIMAAGDCAITTTVTEVVPA